jgi:hypothetical protein
MQPSGRVVVGAGAVVVGAGRVVVGAGRVVVGAGRVVVGAGRVVVGAVVDVVEGTVGLGGDELTGTLVGDGGLGAATVDVGTADGGTGGKAADFGVVVVVGTVRFGFGRATAVSGIVVGAVEGTVGVVGLVAGSVESPTVADVSEVEMDAASAIPG